MSIETDIRAWVEFAEADYDAACAMLRRRRPLNNHACFCSQQCAEKYLKALLVSRDVVVPKTHDLIRLSELCANVGILVANGRQSRAPFFTKISRPDKMRPAINIREVIKIND